MGRKIMVDADALIIRVNQLINLSFKQGWYSNSLLSSSKAEVIKEKLDKLCQEFRDEVANKPTLGT